jgi:endonuclease-3 related protein
MPTLLQVYDRLLAYLGPQNWWPGDSPLEVLIGAVLVQNTSWANAEKAIDNLREADLLDVHALAETTQDELEVLLRPAGYFRQKSARLRNVLAYVVDRRHGSLESMAAATTATLREELLAIKGIGPETADAILLYALEKPSFVVDTYTHRILARHNWIDAEADYHQIKDHFESELPDDPALFNEYHALLVQVGKQYCKKSDPKCDECPLQEWLPE